MTLLDGIKVFGGLLTAIVALFEYAAHNEQERADNVLHAMQLIQQNNAATQLRDDIQTLIRPFYEPGLYEGDYFSDRENDMGKVKRFINAVILKRYDQQFKRTINFFDTIYAYGSLNTCNWLVVSTAFSGDAGEIEYYFWPIFSDFADRQHRKLEEFMRSLYAIEYQRFPVGGASPCDASARKSRLTRLADWVIGFL